MPQDDLFSERAGHTLDRIAPLATRMRPRTLDEVCGQPGLLGPHAAFRKLVEAGRPISMLLWGPPGSGKTTIARLVASYADASFETLSATSAGVKDVREVLAVARRRLETDERRTVLFIDEIHRFSKNQQDALLPGVEDGTIILIGATTENPYFEVNSPLMSRLTLFRTEPLSSHELDGLITRALQDPERGLGAKDNEISEEARLLLSGHTGGDARQALNALEVAAHLALSRGSHVLETEDVSEALQRRFVRYDKAGDQHYDVISAFIKSIRGSDVDAALYWLHFMLEAGEAPEFIARRLLILASEDIGLADHRSLLVAGAAANAVSYVGLPEAAYHLTHATMHLSLAPKSNSVAVAMSEARRLVREGPTPSVPLHLRGSGYAGAEEIGHGVGYRYVHDYPDHIVAQDYFPDGVDPEVLYRPSTQGEEAEIRERLNRIDHVIDRKGRE